MSLTTLLPRRLALALVLLGAAWLVAPLSARSPLPLRLTDSYDQQIASLQARYNSIGGQLQGIHGQEAAVSAQVAAVQSRVAQTQSSLDAVQSQIIQLNTALAATARGIQADTQHLDSDRAQLAQLMVAVYTSGGTSVVASLVDSRDIGQFINKLDAATAVSSKFQDLIGAVQAAQQALQVLQKTQQSQLAQATQLQAQLQSLAGQLASQEAQLRSEERSLTGQAAQLVSQRNSIQSQINHVRAEQQAAEAAAAAAAAGAGVINMNGALQPFAFGSTNDLFPWGQCTWYVASLRNVTWGGNADTWLGHAQAQGYATGSAPRAGSIVVWGSGNGYSVYGHVAYVVAVYGPADFEVDESNYFETPGLLDQRRVTTLNDVEGFIY